MNCNCGDHHHHHETNHKTKEEIIADLKSTGFDIVAEYELIKQKKSNLSANDRKRIVEFMEA